MAAPWPDTLPRGVHVRTISYVACRDVAGHSSFKRRFSWRSQVQQRVNDPADYSVSAADWLVVVEKFGLTPYLEIHG